MQALKKEKPDTQTEPLRRDLPERVENLLPAGRQVVDDCAAVDELRARMKLGKRTDGRPYLHDVWFAWPKLQEQFTYFDLMNAPRHVKERVINEAMARLRATECDD
jgi:hypothetical protein